MSILSIQYIYFKYTGGYKQGLLVDLWGWCVKHCPDGSGNLSEQGWVRQGQGLATRWEFVQILHALDLTTMYQWTCCKSFFLVVPIVCIAASCGKWQGLLTCFCCSQLSFLIPLLLGKCTSTNSKSAELSTEEVMVLQKDHTVLGFQSNYKGFCICLSSRQGWKNQASWLTLSRPTTDFSSDRKVWD